jgi:hypothetical protein
MNILNFNLYLDNYTVHCKNNSVANSVITPLFANSGSINDVRRVKRSYKSVFKDNFLIKKR